MQETILVEVEEEVQVQARMEIRDQEAQEQQQLQEDLLDLMDLRLVIILGQQPPLEVEDQAGERVTLLIKTVEMEEMGGL